VDVDLSNHPETVTTEDGITLHLYWKGTFSRPAGDNTVSVESAIIVSVDPSTGFTLGLHDREDRKTNTAWQTIQVGSRQFPAQAAVGRIEEIPSILDRLADTARARAMYTEALAANAGSYRRMLTNAFRECVATAGDSHDLRPIATTSTARIGGDDFVAAKQNLIRTAARAYQSATLDEDEISQITTLHPRDFTHAPAHTAVALYVDLPRIATRLGVNDATARSYRSRGEMPESEVQLGKTPGWTIDTIEAWIARRPGAGSRTDLKGRTS